jgi:hypothetical protein
MARSSLTYIPGFSVKIFFQPIYTDYAAIGPVVSEEKIQILKFTTYDGRQVMAKAHMAFGQVS